MRKLTMLLLTLLSFTGVVRAQEEDVKAKIGEECYATLQGAIDAAKDGETVTLLKDVTASEIIKIDKAITLDGNDKTLTSNANRAINVTGANGATIQNIVIKANGERGINIIQNATKVTISDVDVSAKNYAVNAASSAPGAIIDITGSTLSGLNVVNISSAGAQVTVSSSTLNCNDQNDSENYAALFLTPDATDAKITATDVTFNIQGDSYKAYTSVQSGKITIGDSEDDVHKAVALIEYANSYAYTFKTLQGAIEYAKAGETVKLVSDVTTSEIIVIDKAITLNGNTKTLTSTAGRAINVTGADGVTIKNLYIDAKGERGINIIQNATNVTINSVTAKADNYVVNVASSAPNANVIIDSSHLTGLNVVNIAAAGAQVKVNYCTLVCNDQNNAENYAALTLGQEATNATITATNTEFVIEGDSQKAMCSATNGTITIGGSQDDVNKSVAVIEYQNSYYYSFSSLEDAFSYVKAGETVKLVNDVTVDKAVSVDKPVTLDFNNFNIACAGNYEGYAFEVTGELKFENKVDGSIYNNAVCYIINDNDYKVEDRKFELTENKEGVDVLYKRTFGHDSWQVLYLPFDIKLESIAEEFDVYTISNITNAVKLEELTEETLSANTHYIIKAKNEITEPKEMYFKANSVTLYGKPENYTETIDGYTITGTYTSKAIEAGQQYVLTKGEWCQLSEAAVTNEQNILGAFRVYLTANGANNASVLRNVINGENATAIDELKATENVNGVIYDLSGRRVEKAVKGVFVVNGKKVVK